MRKNDGILVENGIEKTSELHLWSKWRERNHKMYPKCKQIANKKENVKWLFIIKIAILISFETKIRCSQFWVNVLNESESTYHTFSFFYALSLMLSHYTGVYSLMVIYVFKFPCCYCHLFSIFLFLAIISDQNQSHIDFKQQQ